MGRMGGGVLVNAGAVDQESDDKMFTLCVCVCVCVCVCGRARAQTLWSYCNRLTHSIFFISVDIVPLFLFFIYFFLAM